MVVQGGAKRKDMLRCLLPTRDHLPKLKRRGANMASPAFALFPPQLNRHAR